MVLDQVLNIKSIGSKSINIFVLGVIYSFVGIICARLIFPDSIGLMSVAFTSILLIPSLNYILQQEENAEIMEKKFSFRLLFIDHKDIFRVYLLLFLGIFFAYSITALMWSAPALQGYFPTQLQAAGVAGFAANSMGFKAIVLNNLVVMLVCFVLSLIYGSGAILFLTWNASVWGVVLGFLAKGLGSRNVFAGFFVSVLPFLPHMITEATSYIGASVVGGVVSKAVIREKLYSEKFMHIMRDASVLLAFALFLVVAAALMEVFIAL